MTLGRKFSKHHERWGKGEDELDELDNAILTCISNKPGINITQVWHCISMNTDINILNAYYRVNTLQRAGYLRTEKGNRNERKCFVV